MCETTTFIWIQFQSFHWLQDQIAIHSLFPPLDPIHHCIRLLASLWMAYEFSVKLLREDIYC